MLAFCIHVCYKRDYGIKEINNCHYKGARKTARYMEKCRISLVSDAHVLVPTAERAREKRRLTPHTFISKATLLYQLWPL